VLIKPKFPVPLSFLDYFAELGVGGTIE